jgi:hypothetical protein
VRLATGDSVELSDHDCVGTVVDTVGEWQTHQLEAMMGDVREKS